MFFYTNNSIDLSNIYKTSRDLSCIQPITSLSLTLNGGGLKQNGSIIDKSFSLYKHGTRQKSFLRENDIDIGSLFQRSDVSYAYVAASNYNAMPWNLNNTKLQNAKWIWGSDNASSDASNTPYWFYYTFYYTAIDNSGTLYFSCDNVVDIYFNNRTTTPTISSNNWQTAPNTANQITVKKGLNYIRANASNAGGPAGLIMTLYDISNVCIANTNENWVFSGATQLPFAEE